MTTQPFQDFTQNFDKQRNKSLQLRTGSIKERREKLRNIKDWILEHQEDIKEAAFEDLAKPAAEVDVTEIYPLLSEVRHAIRHLKTWASPRAITGSLTFLATNAHIHYEPKGTSLIISPWNYPILLALGPVISAIAAGCTVTLKPSEFTPNSNAVIGRMIDELFDSAEIRMIEGEAEVAAGLLEQPFDHIFFTGSPAVGKKVMAAAAKNLTSVTLELGGKSPTIVDETANIIDAAHKITWGKWTNAGQTCIAPDYVFVHESRKEALIKAIEQKAKDMYADKKNYTSIINQRHFERLKAYLEDALDKGAQIVFGGQLDEDTCVIQPMVLTDLNLSMLLLEEEIFGPILPILTYKNPQQVIDYINQRPKPLALYIYSQRRKFRQAIIQQTSSGGVVINDNVLQFGHPNLPMGGVNNSGLGKAHGREGFLAFSHPKSILKQRTGFTIVKTVYPPYNTIKKKLIALMLKYF